jgi:hypothetical protein
MSTPGSDETQRQPQTPQPPQTPQQPQPEEPSPTPTEPTGWEPPSRTSDEAVLPEPVFTPFSLTVGDGFKFGCGFTMALVIAGLIGLLALSLVFLLASLVGAPIPVGR